MSRRRNDRVDGDRATEHGMSGFFVRVLAALLSVNLITIGVLLYHAYAFNVGTLTEQTEANIAQQIGVVGDGFEAEYGKATASPLRRLSASPLLDDYLLGSEAERLVLRRRIEQEFRQVVRERRSFRALLFVDDGGVIQAGIIDGRRAPTRRLDSGGADPAATQALTELQERLAATPLLLSSGNMEWFMPPREMQVIGPVRLGDGRPALFAGLARLDTDTGRFGGTVLAQVDLQPWLEELEALRFLGARSLWLVAPDGQAVLHPPAGTAQLDPRPFLDPIPTEARAAPAAGPGTAGLGRALTLHTDAGLLAWRDLRVDASEPFLRLIVSIPADLVSAGFQPAIRFFSAVMVGSIALLVLVSYFISRYLSRPVLALATARNRLAHAQRIARLGHWEWDPKTGRVALSDHAVEVLGLTPEDRVLDLDAFCALAPEADRGPLRELLAAASRDGTTGALEHPIGGDGPQRFVHQEVEAVDGEHRRIVGTVQDITERKHAEARIAQLAYSDTVTGLANRTRLIEMAGQALVDAQRQGHLMAILFIDLDHFKRVNDTLGHEAGDDLLRLVGERLRTCVRATDLVAVAGSAPGAAGAHAVARMGGDEFIVLLRGLREREGALRVARAIHATLTRPVEVAGKSVAVTGSLGLSLYPEHGDTVDELVRHADAAMYHAKSRGRDRFELYSADIDEAARARVSMESRLRRALEEREFRVFYQPRVDLIRCDIVGFEALIRWPDPIEGLVPPDQFIPLAEETGLIVPIGHWVMQTAIRQLRAWRDSSGVHVNMSINLSPAQFRDPDLAVQVRGLIAETRIAPSLIELELTEGTLFHDVDAGVALARELQAAGVRLAVDDFGTGYSSLQLLKRFPVKVLKVDQSFIRDVLSDSEDALIVRTSVTLGQQLGLRVVAEGVESTGQLEFLRSIGCDEAQGYLFGHPMPEDEALALLLSQARVCRSLA